MCGHNLPFGQLYHGNLTMLRDKITFMAFPFLSDFRKELDAKLAPLGAESVLGLDIGTSSIKIVQIRSDKERPVLETYGEIELGPYGNANSGEAVRLSSVKNAAAIVDLLHEVEAKARWGGVAVALSSSLVSVVDLPKRDPEQMNRLIRADAKKIIPVAIDQVTLDWFPIPDEEFTKSAFDRVSSKVPVTIKLQKVFIAATDNEALAEYREIASEANLRIAFYEIESFSAIRSAADTKNGPVILIDLGASTTKICISSRDHFTRSARTFDLSGQKMTEKIMKDMALNFSEAEKLKRLDGLSEKSKIASIIKPDVDQIFFEAKKIIDLYNSDYKIGISNAVFIGGGACMPGIIPYGSNKLGLPTSAGNPFDHTSVPMILEPVLCEAGPKFAVSMGLALRAQSEQPTSQL